MNELNGACMVLQCELRLYGHIATFAGFLCRQGSFCAQDKVQSYQCMANDVCTSKQRNTCL